MSLLGALKPQSLPVFSRAKPRAAAAAAVMLYDLLNTLSWPYRTDERYRSNPKRRQRARVSPQPRSYEDIFIQTLVAASTCRHHCNHHGGLWRWAKRPQKEYSRAQATSYTQRRYASSTEEEDFVADEIYYKDELQELVNTYPSPSDLWHPGDDKYSLSPGPAKALQQFSLAPRLVLPPEKEEGEERYVVPPIDEEHAAQLYDCQVQLRREVGRISLTKLWDSYQALPTPRLRYIPTQSIHRFLRHLAWVEYKHEEAAYDRYIALLEECLGEKIPLVADHWNTAISFSGRWVRGVSNDQVKAAVEMWMRMEQNGLAATHDTFNILFDLAVKANRFALADTIYDELTSRGMELDRYFRTSVIYYAGIRGDGDAVRQAFRDLVNAGEIVDTIIMNCVIASLVRAGEPAAAENVLAKMKRLHEDKMGTLASKDWQDQKHSGARLDREARRLRAERTAHSASFFGSEFSSDDRKEQIQRLSAIAPNERTYRILINHYTSAPGGSLLQITAHLAEMKARDLNIHGSIYLNIFNGFYQHGGFPFSPWTLKGLESFWQEFLDKASLPQPQYRDGITELERAPYFTRGLVTAAVAAFYKCAGRKRMVEVWHDVLGLWGSGMTEDERARIEALVEKFEREDNVFHT